MRVHLVSFHVGQGNTLHCETIAKTHVCVFGFIQPYPFITKVLPMMVAEDDGLYDRFLVCAPKVYKQHMHELTAATQKRAMLPEQARNFVAVLQGVNDCHDCMAPRAYRLTPDALTMFTMLTANAWINSIVNGDWMMALWQQKILVMC